MDTLNVPEAYIPLWTGVAPGLPRIEHYAFFGGRGGAKSHCIAEPIIAHCSRQLERVACGREFQASIRDSVKELLEKKIKSMGMAAFWTSTERELVNVSTGSRISFLGMNRNPDSAKSLEGATIFWGEEAQAFSTRSVEIIVPTIRDPRSRLIWSWNPRFAQDAVDNMFRGPAPPVNSYIKQVSFRDNPWYTQSRMPSERNRMLKSKRYNHVWEGAYDANPDAAIFDNFRVGRVELTSKERPRFGMDFGFSADPNVVIKLYVLESQGIIYICNEAVGYKVGNKQLPDMMDVVPEVRDYPITADSARPETIEYLQSEGFVIYPSRKGAGSVKNGITWLQSFEIVISPDCPVTYAEFQHYKWATDKEDRPLPIPEAHQQDHCIDAIRYAVEDLSTTTDSEDQDDILFL